MTLSFTKALARIWEHPAHPAKFSPTIQARISERLWMMISSGSLERQLRLLDPFAGTGQIHDTYISMGIESVGVELEPEWAAQHSRNIVGNSLHLPFPDQTFDVVVTSPCYGNRMADHHDAKDGSRRVTYKHMLGREPSEDSAAVMQWGPTYRAFHEQVWAECARVAKPGATFILNISDHVRGGEVVPVSAWHVAAMVRAGWELAGTRDVERIPTPRMRFGANHRTRCPYEYLITFTRKAA